MKITSIKLTSQHEIRNSDPKNTFIGASKLPVFQIEYEETTPTGLKATGTMLLSAENEEKSLKFFKELEAKLSSDRGIVIKGENGVSGILSNGDATFTGKLTTSTADKIVVGGDGGTVSIDKEGIKFTGNVSIRPSVNLDKYKWDTINNNGDVDKMLTAMWEIASDAIKLQKKEDVDNFMKEISKRLKGSLGTK